MEAKLVVVGGKANKAEIKLKLPTMVGRGRDADLTVSHATVSRHHCLLFELDGALVVRDNGSLNGTLVHGQRVKEAVLKPGDTLTIGPLTFRADYEHAGGFPTIGEQPTRRADETPPFGAEGNVVAVSSGEMPTIDFHPDANETPARSTDKRESAPAANKELSFPDLDDGSPGTADADSSGSLASISTEYPPLNLAVTAGKEQAAAETDDDLIFSLRDDAPPAPEPAPVTAAAGTAPADEYKIAGERDATRPDSKEAGPPFAGSVSKDQIDDAALAFLNEIGPEPSSDVSNLPQIAPAKETAKSAKSVKPAKDPKPGKGAKSAGEAKPAGPAEEMPDFQPPDAAKPPGAQDNELDDFFNSLGMN